jgi:hypothetical protein
MGLREAGKIQAVHVGEQHGFLPVRKVVELGNDPFIDMSLLTEEERNMRA